MTTLTIEHHPTADQEWMLCMMRRGNESWAWVTNAGLPDTLARALLFLGESE